MEEIWKDIPQYEGYYQVSNYGNFRSIDRIVKYKNFGTRKQSNDNRKFNNKHN